MSESNNIPTLLGEALFAAIRQAVREEIQVAMGQNNGHGSQESEPPPLLNVEELAEKLKVNKSHIYDLTRHKKDSIPHVRIGRYPRFDLSKVLTWLEEKKKH